MTKALVSFVNLKLLLCMRRFIEKSKLMHIGMYHTDMAENWWLAKILDKPMPRHGQSSRSNSMNNSFLLTLRRMYEKNGIGFPKKKGSLFDNFWVVFLKVTLFMTISNEEKLCKFEAGLQAPIRSLKVYKNSTLTHMMESAIIAEELHMKGHSKKQAHKAHHFRQKEVFKHLKAENEEKNSKLPFSKNGKGKKK